MTIKPLHPWPTVAAEAIALQRTLSPRIRLTPIKRLPRLIAGIDVAFSPGGLETIAVAILWDRESRTIIEAHIARRPCDFPYIPGLLTFRELPTVLDALAAFKITPDVVLCDGQGIAHPRRIGIASHLGLWLDIPTIGCAKSRLCGDHAEPGRARGDATPLTHKNESIGVVLRTRDNVRPLYVSPGNLCDIASATQITLKCLTRFRLPEPTRLAHQLVTRERTNPCPTATGHPSQTNPRQ